MFADLLFRLRALWRRSQMEQELEEELQLHVDRQVEQYVQSGFSRDAALREARLMFGGLDQVREECRDQRGVRWVEALTQDVRYGLRMLGKQPTFTAAVVLILALGIGANTAVFSVVESVLLRPLPFRDSARLVLLTEYNHAKQIAKTGAPYSDYADWVRRSHTLGQMAAYWNVSGDGMVFGSPSSTERIRYSIVTDSFFPILGVSPNRGRAFNAADQISGAAKVFLASDALWRRDLGGSLDAVGKTFLLDGDRFMLAGILPPGVSFPEECDVWLPLGVLSARQRADRVSHPFWVLGRLTPEASLQQSQAEMSGIAAELAQAYPRTNENWAVRVTPLKDEFAGNIRQSLLVLFGAVLFILLIACGSVVNLILSRSEARQKEFAVRAALGAGRSRLICQTLVESLLIACLGTCFALLLGAWGLGAITALSAGTIARLGEFHLDGTMLAFAGCVTLATTVLIGLSPAIQLSGARFADGLHDGARGGVNLRSQRLRNALVVAQVSISLPLLCGAGLMLSSFSKLRAVDPGFDPQHLSTVRIALPDAQYPKILQRTQFLNRLLSEVKQLPGVEGAAAVSTLPLSGETNWQSISTDGHPVVDWARAPSVEQRSVSAGYFRTMGIPLLRGQEFQQDQANAGTRGVVINRYMAETFWPGGDPIGHRLTTIDEQPNWRQVIGVVENVKHFGLDADSKPEMYVPYGWWSSMNLVIRGPSDPSSVLPSLRRVIAGLDKGVAIYHAAGMDQVIGRSIASQRLDLYLLLCFALIALVLTTAGIHGLLAFGVNRRRREIGLRMALGASRGEIVRSVIWGGMRLVAVGLAAGVLASLLLTRLLTGLLFRVRPTDPFIFTGVATALMLVALLACWLPARRAALVDPMVALRSE